VEALGLQIDTVLLAKNLGVPVFQTTATRRTGFDQITSAIEQARSGKQDASMHRRLHALLSVIGSEAEALLILEGSEIVAERHGVAAGTERDSIYIDRRNRVNRLINEVVSDNHVGTRLSTLIGRWALNLWTGIPMLLAALYLIYLFVGKLVAQDLVRFTEVKLGQELWEPWARAIVTQFVPASSWLGTILVGEFGIATMTVTYLLFLLLPLVVAFYASLAVMEDSGYLPRLATLVDRSLNAIGLNGSAVIPLILGFGCVTMATITTRMLGSEREKRISTAILQFAIPCSAQLAVVAALLAGAGFGAILIYSATIFLTFVVIGTLLPRVLPGETTPLLIEADARAAPRLHRAQNGVSGLLFHEGSDLVVLRRRSRRRDLTNNGPAYRLGGSSCSDHHRLAPTAARDGARFCYGNGQERFRRGRTLPTRPYAEPNRRRAGHDHSVYAVHRLLDGHAERAWLERSDDRVDRDLGSCVRGCGRPVADADMKTLEEKPRPEERTCPRCRYKITNPYTKRCPRCLAGLPAVEIVCSHCVSSCSCPIVDAAKAK
jgi:hypothetical protein